MLMFALNVFVFVLMLETVRGRGFLYDKEEV
jgi:hypothetical protein